MPKQQIQATIGVEVTFLTSKLAPEYIVETYNRASIVLMPLPFVTLTQP